MSSFLEGDGRENIEPFGRAMDPWRKAMPVRRAVARSLCAMFEESGRSTHSTQGGTVWVIVAYCLSRGIDFTVATHFEGGARTGHEVRRIDRWV